MERRGEEEEEEEEGRAGEITFSCHPLKVKSNTVQVCSCLYGCICRDTCTRGAFLFFQIQTTLSPEITFWVFFVVVVFDCWGDLCVCAEVSCGARKHNVTPAEHARAHTQCMLID